MLDLRVEGVNVLFHPAASRHRVIARVDKVENWTVIYRDHLDQDRVSASIPSKEAALRKARDLYYRGRAEIYRIDGPNGRAVLRQEFASWASENKW